MNLQVQKKKKKTLDSNYCAAVCLFLDDRRRQCWSHTFSLADGAQWRSNHTQLQYNAGGPLLLYPRINTCNSNVTHFHPAPREHRYFRSADLRSPFFFKSSLLQTLSILLISSYLIPNASWWCWRIDRWTAPLLPSDLQNPAVASLALLATAGCQNNGSRVSDVDDDQCIQRRTNYFNRTAMKPTTRETSESVRLSVWGMSVWLVTTQTRL